MSSTVQDTKPSAKPGASTDHDRKSCNKGRRLLQHRRPSAAQQKTSNPRQTRFIVPLYLQYHTSIHPRAGIYDRFRPCIRWFYRCHWPCVRVYDCCRPPARPRERSSLHLCAQTRPDAGATRPRRCMPMFVARLLASVVSTRGLFEFLQTLGTFVSRQAPSSYDFFEI